MKAQELGDADRARRAFGNPLRLREASRDMWGWASMERLVRDVTYALRLMRRSPGFTLVAVLTLALGIGANTAIFTVLYNVVLRPLPYPQPDRLMKLYLLVSSDQRGARMIGFSTPKFEEVRRLSATFEALSAYALRELNLTGAGDPERVTGEFVSAAYFPMLGIRATLGRGFLAEEDQVSGTPQVALLSDGLWRRRFGAGPGVIGKTIRLNDVPVTVVGVAPAWFRGESDRAELWLPLAAAPAILHGPTMLTSRRTHWHEVMGRLKDGMTPEQAAQEVRAIMRRMEELIPSGPRDAWDAGAMPLAETKVAADMRTALVILYAAVAFVLLIACVNLANLLLGRAVARSREVAIRLALGAGRISLVRQFLTETLLLALLGGVAGLLLAVWGMDLLALLRPEGDAGFWPSYMRQIDADALRVSGPVVLFNVLLSLATGVLFGLAPALRASRADVNHALKGSLGGWRPGPRGLRRFDSRRALAAAQMALVLMLLAGAGLMVRSFARLMARPLGIQPDHVLTFRLALPGTRYSTAAARSFFERFLSREGAQPGVESVALSQGLPVKERGTVTGAQIDGRAEIHYVGYHRVHPDFFKVLRISLVAGRFFTNRDTEGSPPVAIVNESAGRDLFGGASPLGHRIAAFDLSVQAEIVGVVADVHFEKQKPQLPLGADVFVCLLQHRPNWVDVAVRTTGDPLRLTPAIRKLVAELDPALPVYEVASMEQHVAGARSHARFSTVLLASFAALALLLATVGVYGVFSYSVAARTRELGVRIALGARGSDVLRLVMREGLGVCLAGLALGLPAAWAATRTLASQLHGLSPHDALTYTSASLLLVAVGLLACYLPAHRATRIDPMEALRCE
jgi:predicted permease